MSGKINNSIKANQYPHRKNISRLFRTLLSFCPKIGFLTKDF